MKDMRILLNEFKARMEEFSDDGITTTVDEFFK